MFYAVAGRIPGSEEDSIYAFEADSELSAMSKFAHSIYDESDVNADDIVELYGKEISVTFVLASESKIDVCVFNT